MAVLKPGMTVNKTSVPAVIYGYQSRLPNSDQKFIDLVSILITIHDQDLVDVTDRFTAGDGDYGVPIGTEITDIDILTNAQIHRNLFVADFSIPSEWDDSGDPTPQVAGEYFVKWTVTTGPINSLESVDAVEYTKFTLVTDYKIARAYAQVQDAIANGFPVSDTVPTPTGFISSNAARLALEKASRYIEAYTGFVFGAHERTDIVYPRNQTYLRASLPIIGISSIFHAAVEEDTPPWEDSYQDLEIYNRHIRHGGVGGNGGDKIIPLIKRRNGKPFNYYVDEGVSITGVFGYTEPDGTTVWGDVPEDIKTATLALAAQSQFSSLWVSANSSGSSNSSSSAIKKIKTFDQEITYDTGVTVTNSNTVDFASITNILNRYRTSIRFGVV